MGVRYIGSKARVVAPILELIGSPSSEDGYFVDAFSGTGVVGSSAADLGWPVRVNDHLRSSMLVSAANLLAVEAVPFRAFGSYTSALHALTECPSRRGFIWREYSPASAEISGYTRMYFSQQNACRIDGMRQQIRVWRIDGLLTQAEEWLLLADLIAAASRVANIAGTYGCFLSKWTNAARHDLKLENRSLREKPVQFEATDVDVADVAIDLNDVAYLDPPYTKRQYAAYYHVQETIAFGDEPVVDGVTGLRPWEEKASDFCYKRRALPALVRLIRNMKAQRVFLSYSSEGHVSLSDLERSLGDLGEVAVHELAEVSRYRPNEEARRGSAGVREYLLSLSKN